MGSSLNDVMFVEFDRGFGFRVEVPVDNLDSFTNGEAFYLEHHSKLHQMPHEASRKHMLNTSYSLIATFDFEDTMDFEDDRIGYVVAIASDEDEVLERTLIKKVEMLIRKP